MDLRTAMQNRLTERAARQQERERQQTIEKANREQRESAAARAIQIWIERQYDIVLKPLCVMASEARRIKGNGYYAVTIEFSPDRIIHSNSQFIFDGNSAYPQPDDIRELWHAVSNSLYVDYTDFIDAAIYASGADDITISNAELAVLFGDQ